MKLTKNFTLEEFESKDGAEMPKEVLIHIVKLAMQLQVIRDFLQVPITINSGYRSPEHNLRIGGVKSSQHILGKAADITAKGYNSYDLKNNIEYLIHSNRIDIKGIGLYDTFLHVDIRDDEARWDYRNNK